MGRAVSLFRFRINPLPPIGTGGGGGGEDFSATLAIGNTTGGTDVSVSAGDAILLEDSNISYQSINFPGLGDTALVFGNNGGVSDGYLFADDITGDYTHISKSGALHLKATTPQVALQIGGNTTTIGTLALTGSRTINFQNASGTLAFLSDIPSGIMSAGI